MKIKVKLLEPFREAAGVDELIIEPDRATISSLLLALAKTYPKLKSEFFDDKGAIRDHINIIVNEKPIVSTTRAVKLKANDEVVIFMAVGGG